MRSAPSDIVLVESLIEGDGLAEPLNGIRDALLEPTAPEFVLLGGSNSYGVVLLAHCGKNYPTRESPVVLPERGDGRDRRF